MCKRTFEAEKQDTDQDLHGIRHCPSYRSLLASAGIGAPMLAGACAVARSVGVSLDGAAAPTVASPFACAAGAPATTVFSGGGGSVDTGSTASFAVALPPSIRACLPLPVL